MDQRSRPTRCGRWAVRPRGATRPTLSRCPYKNSMPNVILPRSGLVLFAVFTPGAPATPNSLLYLVADSQASVSSYINLSPVKKAASKCYMGREKSSQVKACIKIDTVRSGFDLPHQLFEHDQYSGCATEKQCRKTCSTPNDTGQGTNEFCSSHRSASSTDTLNPTINRILAYETTRTAQCTDHDNGVCTPSTDNCSDTDCSPCCSSVRHGIFNCRAWAASSCLGTNRV